MSERWAQIGDSNYYVSDDGRVRGLRGPVKVRLIKGRYMVRLYKRTTTHSVHRLVANAFIPNPDNHFYVRFKDGNMLNCHWSNLEWVPRPVHSCICKKCGQKKPLSHFPQINRKASAAKGVIYRRHTCSSCLGKEDYIRRKEKMIKSLYAK